MPIGINDIGNINSPGSYMNFTTGQWYNSDGSPVTGAGAHALSGFSKPTPASQGTQPPSIMQPTRYGGSNWAMQQMMSRVHPNQNIGALNPQMQQVALNYIGYSPYNTQGKQLPPIYQRTLQGQNPLDPLTYPGGGNGVMSDTTAPAGLTAQQRRQQALYELYGGGV